MMKRLLWTVVPFLFAASGMAGQTVVTLDNYYNHEVKDGKVWHYTWDDTSMGGFSNLAQLFESKGATLSTLAEKPTSTGLKGSDVYIIVDPDHVRDNPNPNFMDKAGAKAVRKWVKRGGTLVLFANDKDNCELDRFNILAEMFGIRFSAGAVLSEGPKQHGLRAWDDCTVTGFAEHPVFKGVSKVFIKGACPIVCSGNAKGLAFTDAGDVVIAGATMGKGRVIAIGDPWIYNEYYGKGNILPRELSAGQERAARQLVEYLLK